MISGSYRKWVSGRAAQKIAKAVREHRLSEKTLDSTNAKDKL